MINLDEEGRLLTSKRVKLKPYIPREFKKYELMTDEEIVAGVGGTLIIDTELYINYFLLAMKDIKTKKIIKFEINALTGECFNERKMSWILHSYRTVGFNSLKYDLSIIWYAYCRQDLRTLKEISDKIILQNEYRSQIEKDYGYRVHQTQHIDLIEVCPLRGSLKLYGARLHAPRIQDIPFNVHEPIDEDQIEIVNDYCISGDLEATEILFNNLTEQLKLREDLSVQYNQDLMSKSDAQIAEAVIGSELKRLTGTWPRKPKIEEVFFFYQVPSFIYFQTPVLKDVLKKVKEAKYGLQENGRLDKSQIDDIAIRIGNNIYRMGSGGLHSSEKNVAIKSNEHSKLYDRDVASYYPAIVLNCKLYPEHIGPEFLKIYKELVDSRIADKKAKRIAQSENKKVTINGTFGKTGSPYSILYAPQMMIQITVTGQLALLMLIEQLELRNIPVVSANTDGILIYCPHDKKEEYLQVIKLWEQITGFETEESEYSAIYSRDVNAYMAIKPSKEVKGKNVYYDPWRGKSAKDQYWRFQKNPTTQICVEAVEKLITENIPIEKTITECTDITKFVSVKNVNGGAHKDGDYLGKVVRWYYAKNIVGTINYIASGNKVPDTDGAKPCMDLPEQFPDDINYDYYINKSVEMLYDMGYYVRQEQLKFF